VNQEEMKAWCLENCWSIPYEDLEDMQDAREAARLWRKDRAVGIDDREMEHDLETLFPGAYYCVVASQAYPMNGKKERGSGFVAKGAGSEFCLVASAEALKREAAKIRFPKHVGSFKVPREMHSQKAWSVVSSEFYFYLGLRLRGLEATEFPIRLLSDCHYCLLKLLQLEHRDSYFSKLVGAYRHFRFGDPRLVRNKLDLLRKEKQNASAKPKGK